MNTHLRSSLLALLATLLMSSRTFAAVDTLTIIHLNDTHSHLVGDAGGAVGGIARAASIIGMWKQAEPNALLVHAGDFMIGTLESNVFWGVPELQLLDMLGCNAMCVGNHEFDAGPGQLGQIVAGAHLSPNFHLISSNADNLDSVAGLGDAIHANAVVQCGAVKVGFVGLTTPSTNLLSDPAPVSFNMSSTALIQSAMSNVMALRGQGCQVVILVSHLGFSVDTAIAPYLQGVDAIIGGHSHTLIPEPVVVNGIPIVQAKAHYHYVGKLRLTYDGTSTHVLDYVQQELTSVIPPEHSVDSIVGTLQAAITQQYTPVMGDPYATITHACDRIAYYPNAFDTLDTPLGNLLTSAMKARVSGADLALEATGHMSQDLFGGPVTAADLFRIYPYGFDTTDGLGFRLASFKLTGTQLSAVMQALLGFVDPTTEYYDFLIQSSGLDFVVDPSGSLVLNAVFVNGRPLDTAATYTIASSDRALGYMMNMFGVMPADVMVYPYSVTQVLREFAAAHDPLCPEATAHNRVLGTPVGVGERAEAVLPARMLGVNFPNPVRTSTMVPYTVRSAGTVRVEIIDGAGRVVRTLVNSAQDAGMHAAQWDGNDERGMALPSGAYVCRMTVHNSSTARSIVLTR